MNSRFVFLVTSLCFVLLAGVPFFRAEAAEPCISDGQFETLDSLKKNPSQDYLEATKQELAARKNLLKGIISCAVAESEQLRATLVSVPEGRGEFVPTEKKLYAGLEAALRYYERQLSDVNQLGVRGTKDVAKALRAWRSSNLEPVSWGITALSLWNKNQALFSTAERRLEQIKETVTTLDLTDNEDIAPALQDAHQHLEKALRENQSAKRLLIEGISFDQSLNTVKSSLDSLAKTYADFFTISEEVKKILPLLSAKVQR